MANIKLKLGPNARNFSSALSNFSISGNQVKELDKGLYIRDGLIQDAVKGGHLQIVEDEIKEDLGSLEQDDDDTSTDYTQDTGDDDTEDDDTEDTEDDEEDEDTEDDEEDEDTDDEEEGPETKSEFIDALKELPLSNKDKKDLAKKDLKELQALYAKYKK